MDPFDGSQSQPPQNNGGDAFWGNEQHSPHQPQHDVNSLFEASSGPTTTITGDAAAASAPELAQPAYSPPADLRGVNSDDFGSDGKESGVPSFEPKKNGHALTEAVQKEIERRTANIDAESKKKEAQLKAAAESYMKGIIAQHEARLKEKRAEQMRLQKANEAKRNEYIKSGAVWSGVELMTDLSKANNYSKGTDRMRNILKKLCGAKEGETVQE
ncbi:hypothetical protein MOQ_004787 [Trypanosoma cruzi marinkellei]|uniref:Clathrin light chain n=1 Tax=Trypanosoma cruzi marinkellei TaxID=85056 RepID=K2N974_TRYCR|nr:hypothetical protein MOQ_004787 [Trypanosoma cruzi marinkellei]